MCLSATASTCNVVLMRNSELAEGIEVFDKLNNVIGSSKVAAKKVCTQTPSGSFQHTSFNDCHKWLRQRSLRNTPKGGRGCLMSPPCPESRGCHLIPFHYLLSCSSAQSCYSFCLIFFSACWPTLLIFFFQKILQYFSLRSRLFCMAPV